jgi:hypothetical protein
MRAQQGYQYIVVAFLFLLKGTNIENGIFHHSIPTAARTRCISHSSKNKMYIWLAYTCSG